MELITKEQHDKMSSRIASACCLTHCSSCPIGRRENEKGKTAGWRCYTNVTDNELVENYITMFGALDDVKDSETSSNSTEINHPSYYNKGSRECIDIMRDLFGDEAVKGFCRCNSFKYRFRAGDKPDNDAEKDLKKAEWYEDYLHKMNVK